MLESDARSVQLKSSPISFLCVTKCIIPQQTDDVVWCLTDIVTSGGESVQGSFSLDQRTVIISLLVSKHGA